MATGDIDQESLNLIIQLQLQDVQHLSKGKGRQGEGPRDLDLAMQLYTAELEALNGFLSDRAMSQSIARAVMQDGDAIAEQIPPQERNAQHREGRDGRQRNRFGKRERGKGLEEEASDDNGLLERLQALYMVDGASSVASEATGESSAWAASRQHQKKHSQGWSWSPSSMETSSPSTTATTKRPTLRACIACADNFPVTDISPCPCSHEYCRGCIVELFRASILDESLFPPRCCAQPIPLAANQTFLPSTLVDEFRAKEVEYNTPNRTYCHRPACSAFIPPESIKEDKATCMKCLFRTCATCKGPAHDEDCPEDPATQEILRVAQEQGWQRCNSCRRIVELNTGCNHITCHCGAQFCYVCGVTWKQCQCPQWHEHLLYERAVNAVDRDAGAQVRRNADYYAALIGRMAEALQQNHGCVRHTWKSRQGRFRCEECQHMLPEFIYECTGCRTLACRRCRFNRL